MGALTDFPEDFAKALQTSFKMLKIFNVRYLEDDKPCLKKYWNFSYKSATIFIHIFGLAFHMPELLTDEEMTQFAYMIPSILVTIHAVLKSIVLIPNTRKVSAFIEELGTLWRVKFSPSQKQEKDALLWRINFINRASFWVSVIGSFLYLLSPLFETLFRRFILKQDCGLILPFASSYPFNPTTNWTIYVLVYIFQLYAMTLLIGMYLGAALIMTTCCALLGTEFVMLRHDLAQVKPKLDGRKNCDVDSDDDEGPTIEKFVERHQKLLGPRRPISQVHSIFITLIVRWDSNPIRLKRDQAQDQQLKMLSEARRLSRQLDNVFNGMVFIDLLFVGITTCAFSFMGQFARGPGYMLISYIGIASSMLTVLYLCYYGELLTRASSSIGDTAYNNLWYEGGKQYKMAILLIIRISQKPCCLTSSRYAVVSLNMFTKVISTTWSYLSLMNSVYSEENK